MPYEVKTGGLRRAVSKLAEYAEMEEDDFIKQSIGMDLDHRFQWWNQIGAVTEDTCWMINGYLWEKQKAGKRKNV